MRWPWNTPRPARIEPTIAVPRDDASTAGGTLLNPDPWTFGLDGGQQFGPAITERTAMTVSTVFRCVTLLSGLHASVPLKIYRDDPKLGQVEAPDHKLYRLFSRTPFPGRALTSHAWREGWGIGVYLWGNHYSVIRYDNAARVIGFEPAPSWAVQVWRNAAGRNQYKITWPGGAQEVVDQDDILHFAGPGFDGLCGVSRIQAFARTSIAVAKTLEEQTGYVHENAARPSGMLTITPGTKPEGIRRMQASFNERYVGRSNAGRTIFVDKDQVYTPFQISPEDLNTIEARKYSGEDICRFFSVPPVMAGVTGDATNWGSGIEQLMLGFLRFTMDGEFQRIESEINAKLFATSDHYAAYDRDALLAMDALASAQVAATEINSAVLTPNEARKKKKRPSLGALGDNALVNSTMVTLERAVNPPAPPAPAAPFEPTPKLPEPTPKTPEPPKPAPKKSARSGAR
jgi:HK97 family phage portal protein